MRSAWPKRPCGTIPPFMASLHISAVVRPLQEETVEQARPLVRTLFLAVAVVLLIACANLAGLLLVRAIRRRREVAVRLALGARAVALLRQAMLESLVLSVSGGLLGLGLAAIALRVGVSCLPETLPRINEIGLDWQVVAFAIGCSRCSPDAVRAGSGFCRAADERERNSEGRRAHRHGRRRPCAAALGAGGGRDCDRADAAGRLRPAAAQLREDAGRGSGLSPGPCSHGCLLAAAETVCEPGCGGAFNEDVVRRLQQIAGRQVGGADIVSAGFGRQQQQHVYGGRIRSSQGRGHEPCHHGDGAGRLFPGDGRSIAGADASSRQPTRRTRNWSRL